MLLKFLELGQPLVNAISLPILTTGAMNRTFAQSFAGATLDPNAKFAVHEAMYSGIRLMNSPAGKKFLDMGEERHLFKSIVSEATELMSHTKSLQPGIMSGVEDALERVNTSILTRGAEISEELVRKSSFMTGIHIAKKAYPGISDTGAMIFARNFMDEAVGNYFAPQRPAVFHGTFGTAIGLFQTYMLTMAQQIYRGVETKSWAKLGKQMLMQSSIFGYASLPGFAQISEQVALNFSDNNVDLETGTFRALPNEMANILLYGLPSSLGPGIVTRGDIQPRVPNPFQGLDSIAAINFAKQGYQAMDRLASAAAGADMHAGTAMLEAISLQSLSRPLARAAEMVNGYSITRSGDKVFGPSEMYTPQSIIARTFSTRPLEEIKLRDMMHLNTVYEGADQDRREGVTAELKSRARNGTLDDKIVEDLAERYMRTGSATGWRSAVNKATAQSNMTGREVIMNKLSNDSPLGYMINNDLD